MNLSLKLFAEVKNLGVPIWIRMIRREAEEQRKMQLEDRRWRLGVKGTLEGCLEAKTMRQCKPDLVPLQAEPDRLIPDTRSV